MQNAKPQNSQPFFKKKKNTKSWNNSTSTIHKNCAASGKHPKNKKSIAESNTSQTSSSAQSQLYEIWGQISGGDWKTWELVKNIFKLEEKDTSTIFSPTDEWSLPAASTIKLEERESLWWTLEQACIWSAGKTLTLPNWIPLKCQLDLLVTVMLLEDTLAVLSLGKLCEYHRKNYHWTSGQKPHLIKHGRKIECNTANFEPFVVPGLHKLFKLIFTYISHIFTAGSRNSHGASRVNKKWEYEWGSMRRLVAWSARMARRAPGEPGRWKCRRTPRRFQFFSWSTFRAASKSGIG